MFTRPTLTKLIADLADKPSMSSAELKVYFDNSPIELKDAIIKLQQELEAVTGASHIGATVTGLTENTISTLLTKLKSITDTNAQSLTTHKTSSDHDGRYYPKTEVDTKLGLKSDKSTTYTKTESDGRFTNKTGDHQGTWQGLTPSQVDQTINNRVALLEEQYSAPEYSSLLTQDKDIFTTGTSKDGTDVSANVVDGALSDIRLKGMTRTNLALNFNNSKWVKSTVATVISDRKLQMIGDGSLRITKLPLTLKPNTEYTLKVKITGAGFVDVYKSGFDVTDLTQSSNKIKFTTPSDTTGIELRCYISDSTTTIFEDLLLEEGDKLAENYIWIDGTKSTVSVVVDSVGKNLFDGILEQGTLNDISGALVSDTTAIRSKNFIRIDNIKVHLLKNFDGLQDLRVYYFDSNRNYISYANVGGLSFTPPINAGYLKFRAKSYTSLNDRIMLVEGTNIPTTYEPYKLSRALYTLPTGEELRKLPNGIYDEVSASGVWTKRTNKENLQTSGWVFNTNNGSYSTCYKDITLTSPYLQKSGDINHYFKSGSIDFNQIGQVTSITNMPTDREASALYSSGQRIYVTIANSRLSTLDNAGINAFMVANQPSLIYQLANEVTTQLSGVTIPTGFEKGTITIRPQDDLTEFVTPEFEYKVTLNKSAQIDGNTRMIQVNSNQIIDIYATLRANNLI